MSVEGGGGEPSYSTARVTSDCRSGVGSSDEREGGSAL